MHYVSTAERQVINISSKHVSNSNLIITVKVEETIT